MARRGALPSRVVASVGRVTITVLTTAVAGRIRQIAKPLSVAVENISANGRRQSFYRRLPLSARDASIRAMSIHVYQYPKCSTCRKALKWLGEHGIEHTQSDLVAAPISLAKLRDLHKRSGLPIRRFFNTSGESYRNGGFGKKLPGMSDAEALAALAEDGKLVKRPIVDTGKTVLVGFDEDVYAETLR
jgi:arsenate reductase